MQNCSIILIYFSKKKSIREDYSEVNNVSAAGIPIFFSLHVISLQYCEDKYRGAIETLNMSCDKYDFHDVRLFLIIQKTVIKEDKNLL